MDESRLALKYKRKIARFYIWTIAILACWLGLSVMFAVWILSFADEDVIGLCRDLAVAILPIAFSVFAIVIFLAYAPNKPRGYTVTSSEAPALFRLIDSTAKSIDYKGRIDEVLLTPGMTIRVYYEPNLKNFIAESTCKLYIGVGLCRYLSQTELQAVIGHELAHFAQPQTKYKAYLARMTNISMALGKIRTMSQSIKHEGVGVYALPAKFLCCIFNSMFERMLDVNSAEYVKLNHDMELDADRISSGVFGRAEMLSALCKSLSINARLGIYKNLILPYIACEGYGCGSFWTTFDRCSGLFEKIDGLKIDAERMLTECNRLHFDVSEMPMPLRLEMLKKDVVPASLDKSSENAVELFPATVVAMMDRCMSRKYKQIDSFPIPETRLNEILDIVRDGIFAQTASMDDAYAVMAEIKETIKANNAGAPQTIMPEYETPRWSMFPHVSFGSPTEFIFSSGADKCPVCGQNVDENMKICPHCHEIIAE